MMECNPLWRNYKVYVLKGLMLSWYQHEGGRAPALATCNLGTVLQRTRSTNHGRKARSLTLGKHAIRVRQDPQRYRLRGNNIVLSGVAQFNTNLATLSGRKHKIVLRNYKIFRGVQDNYSNNCVCTYNSTMIYQKLQRIQLHPLKPTGSLKVFNTCYWMDRNIKSRMSRLRNNETGPLVNAQFFLKNNKLLVNIPYVYFCSIPFPQLISIIAKYKNVQ